jgi:hypothetical protein
MNHEAIASTAKSGNPFTISGPCSPFGGSAMEPERGVKIAWIVRTQGVSL